jgi:AraC-like DNA-binding protein
MSQSSSCDSEKNLAHGSGVRVQVSVANPTGRASRDPHVLLRDPPFGMDGQPLVRFLDYRSKTYDTYDGHNEANGLDWYAIHFEQVTELNCIEMTMECPNRDGGWWRSLWVEYWEGGQWFPVTNLTITPPYPFEDVAFGRIPYDTHALTFEMVSTKAVRIIGQPGGLAQFTSLSYMAVFHRDLSRWDASRLPKPPMPYLFRLISPNTIWDLSESLAKLTGLSVQVAYMDHYLDRPRYQRWWQRLSHNFQGKPDLWHLMGSSIGWDAWNRIEYPPDAGTEAPRHPYVHTSFHNTLARAVAPIIVDDTVLGEISSHAVLLEDGFDEQWHQTYAEAHGIPWDDYCAAVARSPHMSMEQLEGAAELLGMIANTLANLAHDNERLERELMGVRTAANQRAAERRQLVQTAIQYMQNHLEDNITIQDVARAVALSPTYFGILFGEQTGMSPIAYLIDLRIQRAKEYLAHTSMSVMEVCVALTYNPSYFNRLFKQHVGMTPGQYAHKMRSNAAKPIRNATDFT